ncbi:hypothetical protein ABW19_dt0201728 [Dactylella cylindrospora]|nr:hypothetical protein ABW19_dt0201728 [Dactylella cylindrospora]
MYSGFGYQDHGIVAQYHADTNYVAKWLKETAESQGYPIGDDYFPQPHKFPNTDYFIYFAKFVALSTTPPKTFFERLDRAIDGRQRHSREMRENYPHHEMENYNHQYFIEVLEKVRTILRNRDKEAWLPDSDEEADMGDDPYMEEFSETEEDSYLEDLYLEEDSYRLASYLEDEPDPQWETFFERVRQQFIDEVLGWQTVGKPSAKEPSHLRPVPIPEPEKDNNSFSSLASEKPSKEDAKETAKEITKKTAKGGPKGNMKGATKEAAKPQNKSTHSRGDCPVERAPIPISSPSLWDDAIEEYLTINKTIKTLSEIREHIKGRWRQYALSDDENAMTPAILTNMAIIQVRQMEEDLKAEFPELETFAQIGDRYFYRRCCHSEKLIPAGNTRPLREICYDLATESMHGVYCSIKGVFAQYKLDQAGVTILRHNHSGNGVYDPTKERSEMTDAEKLAEDDLIVLTTILDSISLSKLQVDPDADEDEIFNAVRQLYIRHKSGQDYPLWAVFALQIVVDIFQEIKPNISKAFWELQMVARNARAVVSESLRYRGEGDSIVWREHVEVAMGCTVSFLGRIIDNDVLYDIHRRSWPLQTPIERFRLSKISPVRCGTLILQIKSILQQHYFVLINNSGSIAYAMHLYNALQNEKLISPGWEEMDILRKLYGDQTFFVGDAPKTRAEFLTRFRLATGVSLKNYAVNRRLHRRDSRDQPDPWRIRVIPLTKSTPVTDIFMRQCIDPENKLDTTTYQMIDLIVSSVPAEILGQMGSYFGEFDGIGLPSFDRNNTCSTDDEKLGNPKESEETNPAQGRKQKTKKNKKNKKKKKSKKGKKKSKASHEAKLRIPSSVAPGMTSWVSRDGNHIIPFLNLLDIALNYEVDSLDIDYFNIHKTCSKVLRVVRREVLPVLKKDVPTIAEIVELFEDGDNGFFLDFLFKSAFGDQQLAGVREQRAKKTDSVGLFERVAQAVEDVIRKGGESTTAEDTEDRDRYKSCLVSLDPSSAEGW